MYLQILHTAGSKGQPDQIPWKFYSHHEYQEALYVHIWEQRFAYFSDLIYDLKTNTLLTAHTTHCNTMFQQLMRASHSSGPRVRESAS